MKTSREIKYYSAPMGYICTIPKGTPVVPARNLPDKMRAFWAKRWEGMNEQAESYYRNYGFLLYPNELENDN